MPAKAVHCERLMSPCPKCLCRLCWQWVQCVLGVIAGLPTASLSAQGFVVNMTLTLDNCAQEPIHTPGLIQPHGALLAFSDAGKLLFASANVQSVLGTAPKMGDRWQDQSLDAVVLDRIGAWFSDSAKTFAAFSVAINNKTFDMVGHRNDANRLIVEFESTRETLSEVLASADTSFATLVHRSMAQFKRQTDIDELLGMVAKEVRSITGFDRVMAYRFLHDDSGEVVRESRREDLEDWEGHRYPSSDIPAQARRLYVANTLRLIEDVAAVSVPLMIPSPSDLSALDMSFCVLRSVSPIHIEYLTNMGVAASLSISIVINNRLWGMIACHHGAPRHVPYGVRMVCEVVGQMVSVSIASLETTRVANRLIQATASLAQLGIRARLADDLLTGLATGYPNPQHLVEADVALCLWGGRAVFCKGHLSAITVKRLAELLDAQNEEMITTSRIGDVFGELKDVCVSYCGIHAVCFDVGRRGWVVWLRREQIENVRWAGRPIKELKIGPNGPRLTPRGSFREWREEVRGSSMPWDVSDIGTAEALRAELSRIAGMHAIEMEKARHQLLAALGHDLREPLHSIALAGQILKARGEQDISARIATTSGRMTRLITQILDMSLLQSDGGIMLNRTSFDLAALLREAVEDANFSYAGSHVTVEAPETLLIDADRDRLSQVLSNLLSNARHHGDPGQPVMVSAKQQADMVIFFVRNTGAAIPLSAQADLFKALKPTVSVNPRNRTGLGLGLYIAAEIVKAHGGELSLECADNQITFIARLPSGER